jgi:hypothetical protein
MNDYYGRRMSHGAAPSTTATELLRHTVATLAYRAEKVLRDPPDGFAAYRLSPSSRTPLDILEHMGDLVEWGDRMARGEYRWEPAPTGSWAAASDRFFRGLLALDESVGASTFEKHSAGQIFQGPIADALTHVGQLAKLRGAISAPVKPESYARAEIRIGRVGREQAPPRAEFDGDASRRT